MNDRSYKLIHWSGQDMTENHTLKVGNFSPEEFLNLNELIDWLDDNYLFLIQLQETLKNLSIKQLLLRAFQSPFMPEDIDFKFLPGDKDIEFENIELERIWINPHIKLINRHHGFLDPETHKPPAIIKTNIDIGILKDKLEVWFDYYDSAIWEIKSIKQEVTS